jgi:hypothetical protein
VFVGHFAAALLAKRAAPEVRLPFLVLAAQLLDVLWPVFILAGLEHARIAPGMTEASPLDLYDYPWSHSLAMALLWSALLALPWLLRRRWRAALVVGACVLSHFVLDVVSHRPDVPLAPGSSVFWGLGLWRSRAATVLVEGGLWAASVWVYARATRATSSFGRWGLAGVVAVLTLFWLAAIFGPPPPGIGAVAGSAIPATAIFLLWFWAIDRRRAAAVPG